MAMRIHLFVAAIGFLSCATALANAADKTVHDQGNGFSLTFPEEWTNEPPSDKEILLAINSGERGVTCMVSGSRYSVGPGSPADPRKFIEGWSMNDWKWMIGRSYTTAEFTNDKLARFPDGYPVRLSDVDFTVSYEGTSLYGHSRFAFSARGDRYAYVNCSVMGVSAEQVAQQWAPLAADAERVVSSFILEQP